MKIVLHPSRPIFASLLSNLGAHGNVTFDGDVFRFIHPQFSKPAGIVSGIGALHAAGRWNIAGSYRLSYTAVAPETALAEALAHVRYYNLPLSNALPRVLVALHLKASRVLDLTGAGIRRSLKLSLKDIFSCDWRNENMNMRESMTQAWGAVIAKAGLEAVIVPSTADSRGQNLLVFPENLLPGSEYNVVGTVKWK